METEHDEIEICCDDYAMDLLAAAAKFLGWTVVIPETGDGGVPGLVIGTDQFCEDMFNGISETPSPMPPGDLN